MAESLGSDHVNYLVFRYLQEAGHEAAAKALYNDWHRPLEFRDPEDLPFAPNVRQHELINIIQDGLFHDQLTASVTKQDRRFRLTEANVSRRASAQAAAKQIAARRRASMAQAVENDEFPTPAAKRPRRSNGEEMHINGDAMEVDSRAQEDVESGSGLAETDREKSEAEPVVEEERPPVELLSSATQTEKKLKPKTETMYWTLERPESSIYTTMWNPSLSASTRLLTVGESLCRFYDVPTSEHSGVQDITHEDAENMPSDSLITAACWHPSGQYATCVMEASRQINGSREPTHRMFDFQNGGGKQFYDLQSYLLKPNGLCLALRYDSTGSYLLSVSTNDKRGLVEVWDVKSPKGSGPCAFRIFDKPVLDAVWTSPTSFVVCGDARIEHHELSISPDASSDSDKPTIAENGAWNITPKRSFETTSKWDKIRFDPRHGHTAVNSTADERLLVLDSQNDTISLLEGFPPSDTTDVTAMAFQTTTTAASSNGPTHLALARNTGSVNIYHLTRDRCESHSTLSLEENEPALALAWSPDGMYLAASSDESIRVWNAEHDLKPVLEWRAEPHLWRAEQTNGEEGSGTEPSLDWDAEGRKLVFAIGRKVAVIRLRSEGKDVDMVDANGA